MPVVCTDKPFLSEKPRLLAPHARPLTLRTSFVWSLAGQVAYSACQLGILVVLAKLGTPEMVGEFALALAIASPIMICAGLSSLRIVQATDGGGGEYRFGDYLLRRLLTTVAGLLAIFGVLCFSGYEGRVFAIVMTMGFAKGLENISDVFCGLLQQHERMDRVAVSGMIRGLLSLGGVAFA